MTERIDVDVDVDVDIEQSSEPIVIGVPTWVDEMVAAAALGEQAGEEALMRLAIGLSRENVARGGGPFGALVCAAGRVIAGGVNLVLASGQSIAHAEIVAIMRAQQRLSQLSAAGPLSLFATTEPCCQCFGALIWSGATRLVCGAHTDDAQAIGFDEGPKPSAWPAELEARGISVARGVCSEEANSVLLEYARRGGPIYGLRSPSVNG
jgi:tRNA(Arg) A34 adenosine deaminase TadA